MTALGRTDTGLQQELEPNDLAHAAKLATDHLVQPWPTAGSIGRETRGMVEDASGVYIRDDKGRRLIDGPAGMWCTNV
ncbi:MAG: hypothetical protein KDE45_07865, partial [Caldilineaceae bacterium]|nr:hypothetical protein [Caldilineaceae bacterium]